MRKFVLIAALLAVSVVSGCAQVPPETTKTAPSTVPSPVATATPAHETASPLPSRDAELQNLATSAGFVVARWLDADTSGEVERMVYEDQTRHFTPTLWQPGMSGWGTLSLNWGPERQPASTTARAVVFIDDDGKVDYNRPVKSVWLDLGAAEGDLLAGIDYDINQAQWVTWLSQDETEWYPLYYSCPTGDCQAEGGEEALASPAEIKILDNAAKTSLIQSMNLQFGRNWGEEAPQG